MELEKEATFSYNNVLHLIKLNKLRESHRMKLGDNVHEFCLMSTFKSGQNGHCEVYSK